jgi:uncharacterized protein (TIGR01777 family)
MDPLAGRQGRVLISGARGLIARYLIPRLEAEGKRVVKLKRLSASERKSDVSWNINEGTIDVHKMEQLEAVIHLAGEPLIGRWTDEKKKNIYRSRVDGTRLLCETLAKVPTKPQVIICASAIGYYGDRGDEILDEGSSPGKGFLADLCQEWEAACQPAVDAGIRVIHARFGMVISANGGGLKKMLLPFKMGLGGKLGSGQQYMSWIAIQDVVEILLLFMKRRDMEGAYNVVAPSPVQNEVFTKTLGTVLKRPTFANIPESILRRMMGEMADEMLLSSSRVLPRRLLESGFQFCYEDIETAFKNSLQHQ